jgi:acyl-coenzyme A synthetase/AMP-(fatty) acid ligase
MHHLSGLFILMLAMARRSPAVILERFSVPAFLDALEAWPIRQIALNPAMLSQLVECEDERADSLVGQLVLVRSGSAPLPPRLRKDFCNRFAVPLLQGYGSTETGGEIAGWTDQDLEVHGHSKVESVGRLKPGISVEIRDDTDQILSSGEVGRLAVRVPWFSEEFRDVGDLGYLDDDGFLFLIGRSDDVIDCGGLKIYPAAVEEALEQCPEIAECAIVPEADALLGQAPVAYVVPGAPGLTAEAVDAFARRALLAYQCPRRIYIVDALPRNDLGNVVRTALRGAAQAST